jgi:hypothetical protein
MLTPMLVTNSLAVSSNLVEISVNRSLDLDSPFAEEMTMNGAKYCTGHKSIYKDAMMKTLAETGS